MWLHLCKYRYSYGYTGDTDVVVYIDGKVWKNISQEVSRGNHRVVI